MRKAKLLGGAVILLGASACSSSGSEQGPDTTTLACADGELRIQGQLGDDAVDLQETYTSYFFENKLGAGPGRLSAATPSGQLLLEFDMLTAFGETSAARGSISDTNAAIDFGNCATEGFPSSMTISSDGNTLHFALKQLRSGGPAYCAGDVLAGSLSGCIRND